MSNLFFESHIITIRRMRTFGNNFQNYSATFTAYAADIQPSGDVRQGSSGRIGSAYEGYVEATCPIAEGDQLTDNYSNTYSVKSVIYYHGAGLLDHKHLILESQYNG